MESANEQRRNEFGQRAKKKGLAIVTSPFLANLVAGARSRLYRLAFTWSPHEAASPCPRLPGRDNT
jgi:hypothetical protein